MSYIVNKKNEEAVIAVESRDHAKNNGVIPKDLMSRINNLKFVKRRKGGVLGVCVGLLLLAAGAGTFSACKKDGNLLTNSLKNNPSMAYYNDTLVSRFMQEALVCEFREYVNSLRIEKVSNILKFENPCCVIELYDNLIAYSQRWDNFVNENPDRYRDYIESERFPRYPMLFAFEVITDFYSLRAKIENELLELEVGDGIPDDNNPDDHFIVSNHMRTLLTPDCEIIAGNAIFLHGKYQELIIFDLDCDKLSQVKALWRQYGEIDGTIKVIQRSLARLAPMHKSDYGDCANPCANVKIRASLYSSAQCSRTYDLQYSPLFYDDCCMITKVEWNFGDGTTANTGHNGGIKKEYKQAGTYIVTVKLTIVNTRTGEKTECTAKYNLSVRFDCEVTIDEPVRDPTFGGPGAKYKFSAKAVNCNSTSTTSPQYTWYFGDGTTYGPTPNSEVEHIYTINGQKIVTVSVNFGDCSASDNLPFYVTGTGNCCRSYTNDLHVNFCYDKNGSPIAHDDAKYKLSHYFTTQQWYLWHRIVVKNALYKRNDKGNWQSQNAYNLFANFSGEIGDGIDDNCGTLSAITPPGKTSTNQSSHEYNYGVRDFFSWLEWFSVGKETLGSEFKFTIYSSQVDHKTNVLKQHNKTCP